MKRFIILILFLLLWPAACAAEKINGLDVQWGSGTSYTLSWANPSVTVGNYIIKVLDFNWKGDAVVSVTRKGVTQTGIISQGENLDFNFTGNPTNFEGVRIYPETISNFEPLPTNIGTYPCCPEAEITVYIATYTPKKPVLQLVLSPNWDGRSGVPSTMNFEVTNTGDSDFSAGNITVNFSGLEIANKQELSDFGLIYNPSKSTVTREWYTPLLANHSYSFNLSLKSPFPSNKSSFTISVMSYFKDYNGNEYPATASATVSLNPGINLEKLISPSTIIMNRTYSSNEIDTGYLPKFFGLQAVTVVDIYVENKQSYPLKSVILNDSIIDGFSLDYSNPPTKGFSLENATLQWVFDLNASERKEFRYEMNAQKIGTFTAPAAVAQWNAMGVTGKAFSNMPETQVYGAYVVVTTQTNNTSPKLNESLNVITTLENIGDFPVGLNASDVLPENTTFISGTMTFSGYLYPKSGPVSFNYNLSVDKPGTLDFPLPSITFWKNDYVGSFGVIPGNNITVIDPSKVLPDSSNVSGQATPVPTATPIPKSLLEIIDETVPWLEGAVPIFMLIVAIILMLMLHVISRES
jgi:uncharacterized repeat protein (TIGR01451 family)